MDECDALSVRVTHCFLKLNRTKNLCLSKLVAIKFQNDTINFFVSVRKLLYCCQEMDQDNYLFAPKPFIPFVNYSGIWQKERKTFRKTKVVPWCKMKKLDQTIYWISFFCQGKWPDFIWRRIITLCLRYLIVSYCKSTVFCPVVTDRTWIFIIDFFQL